MKNPITHVRQWLRFGAALFVTGTLLYACRPDPNYYDPLPSRAGSILNDLSTDPNYSLFVQAAQRTGFKTALGDGAGVFTVFAPNNQAFQALLQAQGLTTVEAAPIPQLRQVVQNHIVINALLYPSDIQSYRFNNKRDNRYLTIQGERVLTVRYNSPTDFTVNGVKVVGDVKSTGNGVYYAIEQGLPIQRSADSLINTTAQYSEFAKLVNRFKFRAQNPRQPLIYSADGTKVDTNFIVGTNLTWNLRAETNVYTLLAPTNDAIRAFLTSYGYSRVEDIPNAAAQQIVQSHIIPPADANTFTPAATVASLTAGRVLRAATGTVTIGTDLLPTNIVQPDVTVSNGLVHGINKVLAPAVYTKTYGRAFLDPNLTIWTAIFGRAEAAAVLDANETRKEGYTILAPRDAAFLAAGITLVSVNSMTKSVAEAIVNNHTVSARSFSAADFVANTAYATYAGPAKTYTGAGKFTSVGGKTVTVVKPDVKGPFGVLHTIDGLLDR